MDKTEEYFSIPLEGTKQPGFSHIFRNSKTLAQLALTPVPGVTDLKQLYLDLFLNKYKNRKYLATIHVETVKQNGQTVEKRSLQNILTYREGYDVAVRLASALLKKKLIHQQNDLKLIGIYSRNRQQFYLQDLACVLYGITCVPLYDTLGIDNLSYCLQHSNISTCVCSTNNAKMLLSLQKTANLKNIILCDPIQPQLQKELKKKFNVFYFWKLIQEQKLENIINHQSYSVDPEQCFTFSYTSGTTGPPKAAMLSHKNFLSFVAGFNIQLEHLDRKSDEEVHLSILPMPHVYERIMVLAEIVRGSLIVSTSGNILKIKEDFALVRPTQIIAVPRLYNQMLQGILQTLGGEENVRKLIKQNSPIFKKIRQAFGGRVKWMLTGSAPISVKVLDLFGKIMGCPFIEAYGQTENTGGAFISNLNSTQYGKVGHIWPCLQFKLADIPEMGYTSNDKDQNGKLAPRGQIWLRGNAVILGYYKQKQLTEEAITPDKWLKTGDVGQLTPGTFTMKLIDRKKNIFKLSQGEYVSSEKVEFFYMKSKYITQVFLHGDSLQNYAVCIAVANKQEIEKLGQQLKIKKDYTQLCDDRTIILHILTDLIKIGHQNKLNGFQQAKNLRLESQSFAARGIVSSTMKLQRFQARKYYKKQIDEMYAEKTLIQHAGL